MIKLAVALGLIFSALSAEAARFPRPQKPVKCERVLVSDAFQEDVNKIGRDLGELLYQAREKDLQATIAKIEELRKLVSDVRAAYTVSVVAAEGRLNELKEKLDDELPGIRNEINGPSRETPVAIKPDPSRPTYSGQGIEFLGITFGPPNSNEGP